MWDIIKYTNTCIMGLSERRERGKKNPRNNGWKHPKFIEKQ